MMPGRALLAAGGVASAAAAVAHLLCTVGGPAWYRAMGAGPRMVREAERGTARPALIATAIGSVLALWAAYAFSGAGLLRALPLLRIGLVAITAAYLLRGMVMFQPAMLRRPDLSPAFLFRSSAVVLAIGLVHLAGLLLAWRALGVS